MDMIRSIPIDLDDGEYGWDDRDILTILVSTIPSASAFSIGGRIIEERRTSLTSDMVEVLTCLRYWEHTEKKIQHTTHNKDWPTRFMLGNHQFN